MSIKEKRKARRDHSIYSDLSQKNIKSLRPNLYKLPEERGKLDKHLFSLGKASDNYRKEIRIKGIETRFAEEIALTSWL